MKCNTCESSLFEPFDDVSCNWSGIPLKVVKCKNCQLVFLNPRPDKSLGKAYFDKAYANEKGFENIEYYRDDEYIFNRNETRFSIVKNLQTTNKKILDFGAGQAHFLELCRQNGWTVSGVEQSPEAIKSASQRFNIELDPDLTNLSEASFDVITLWDVIEHLESPKELLLVLTKYLKKDGYLIIETSDIDSYDYIINRKKWSYWHLDHYFYYSKSTLSHLLKSIDLELVNSDELLQNNSKGTKKNKFSKYFKLKSYIHLVKILRSKRKNKNLSANSLMILVAKKVNG